METISHRELRNNSAEVLRRVGSGETLLVTNNGRPAALISPPPSDRYGAMMAAGLLRPAAEPLDVSSLPEPAESDVDTAELLRQLRGDR